MICLLLVLPNTEEYDFFTTFPSCNKTLGSEVISNAILSSKSFSAFDDDLGGFKIILFDNDSIALKSLSDTRGFNPIL